MPKIYKNLGGFHPPYIERGGYFHYEQIYTSTVFFLSLKKNREKNQKTFK